MTEVNELNYDVIFHKGKEVEGPLKKVFTGSAWVEMLVTDQKYNCPVYNVTFEPSARNYWHSHPGGQILLVTGGEGYYQEAGKLARSLKKGDIVEIPPNTKHWHGASKNSWFTHIGITTNPQAGSVEWFEEVSDQDYNKL